MKVSITVDDILTGNKNCVYTNPVVRSIDRTLNRTVATVTEFKHLSPVSVGSAQFATKNRISYIPRAIVDWLWRFNTHQPVFPIEFEVNL